jgi:hypothetical protein
MDSKGKERSFTVSDKINILVKVDAHIGTCVELASQLRLSVSKLNITVKNHEETERSYIQCGPFSKQQETFTTGETGICTCCVVQASM